MTQPPNADPTLWELHRALQQLRQDQSDGIKSLRDDLRGDLAAMSARFEEMVTKEVYQADQRLVNQRLGAIEEAQRDAARARESDQQQAANTRKWLVSAFVAPVLIGLLQLWLSSRIGAGP
ncbi:MULTISPECIES: hypothetical protein [unclassified Streptomyces]|uniref:hypothetical protein n=1 Tax=unclassified Streptomyces TaxID=2593676 RepID=UPI002E801A91|nr:hypothetical protein [Streptomyces sp. NBC_00589]WTI37434.1 hypothetical protein OIC96_21665 [Streptomyces sp. NBC_00775]WUB28889.1 hypothetical protein OHA51_28070 [Streptomyces sp. NBC_00589]